uniref:Translocon-associated protein subunit alpha n=1 Tax=Steinernema glaseri TaxID=37863 RepID=A0A1I7Z0L0_9BILA
MLRVLLPAAWFGFSAALYIQTLFVPLLVLDRTNCSSVYWLSVEGAQAQVSEDFCADGPKAIRIVNTAPEIFLAPDQQKDQFELRVNVSNSVFSAAFSINDTEGDTEALERIPLRLTNADGSSINAAVFARFVFTNVEFSDTALMVLSIVVSQPSCGADRSHRRPSPSSRSYASSST